MNVYSNRQLFVAGNTCEGALQNVTQDNIFNLRCIPSGSIVLFFNILCVVELMQLKKERATLNKRSNFQWLLFRMVQATVSLLQPFLTLRR